jgi:hypothetical protein
MKTPEGWNYCPWPSPDPFVLVHQLLESRFGMYENGGRLVTEMIVAGGLAGNTNALLTLASGIISLSDLA